jgi:deoxyadenosine/deoxycytidine kinase
VIVFRPRASSGSRHEVAVTADEEKSQAWPHRLVVVEGLIGVGKTSLARKLAGAVGAGTVFEQPMDNPFLERFYKDRRAAAFPAQLYFLFQRARQLAELRQHDLFAQVRLAMDAPVPDLVVFLQAPVDVLLQRIDRRGIPYEKYIDAAYLERLGEAYTRYFHQYTASPLLIVNTAEIDPANNSRDFEDLFETIRSTTSGRHYLNPMRG